MSKTERKLWMRLRGRRLRGAKFRRQVPIGPYYADFACLPEKLVVEVDGEHHDGQRVYDATRDRWLRDHGYRVLRFWASEVDEDLDVIVTAIEDLL